MDGRFPTGFTVVPAKSVKDVSLLFFGCFPTVTLHRIATKLVFIIYMNGAIGKSFITALGKHPNDWEASFLP